MGQETEKRMTMGQWQKILVCETDNKMDEKVIVIDPKAEYILSKKFK